MPVAPTQPHHSNTVDIRFISSLTAEDEARIAPALAAFLSSFLDSLPLAYTVRIETVGGQVYQRTHPTMLGTPHEPEPVP
jgi:hypothetical protein